MYKKIIALVTVLALCFTVTACGGNKDEDTIKLATKPMTEQFILSEMFKILIEDDTDFTVDITKGVGGGTTNIDPGLDDGTFDMYVDYTGTLWNVVLKKEEPMNPDTMVEDIRAEYKKRNLLIMDPLGFNNSFSIGMLKEKAEPLGLEKISDLSTLSPDLVFGANPDFISLPSHFPALEKAYNLNFKAVKDIDIALRYQALDQGDIDVTTCFTTDPQLATGNYKLLEDDKHLFPQDAAVVVVREDLIKNHPELKEVFDKLAGLITEDDMQKMCYRVDVDGEDDKTVALDFLKEKQLFE